MILPHRSLFLLVVPLALAGCKTHDDAAAPSAAGSGLPPRMAPPILAQAAFAELNPTQGNAVHGKISFLRGANGVRVVGDVTGLTPGKHGFHIHESGDCSAPDGSSAKGHFNPYSSPHGGLNSDQRHTGDLGNLEADASGKAHVDFTDVRITFDGLSSILGKAVIVHANPDDFVSQPVGNAGPRVACGVIQTSP